MSQEKYFMRVGLFVLVGAVLMAMLVVLLAGRDLFAPKVRFETYFEESVLGLEVGSPVKLRGVPIGNVSQIGFVGDHYELPIEVADTYDQWVLVLIDVRPPGDDPDDLDQRTEDLELALEQGLRLQLTSSGITGQSLLNAVFLDSESQPPHQIFWQPHNLYIPSAPSPLQQIQTSAERIFSRLEKAQLEQVVAHVDELVLTVTDRVGKVDTDGLSQEAKLLLTDLRATSTALRSELERSDGSMAQAREALVKANAVLLRMQRMLDGSRYDIESTMENLRVTSENLRELSETVRKQPSLLLRSGEPAETEELGR